jgi:hypothetical protein
LSNKEDKEEEESKKEKTGKGQVLNSRAHYYCSHKNPTVGRILKPL